MWQILHASFWKFSKLSNSRVALNWSITDEVTIRNKTAYLLAHSVSILKRKPQVFDSRRNDKYLNGLDGLCATKMQTYRTCDKQMCVDDGH